MYNGVSLVYTKFTGLCMVPGYCFWGALLLYSVSYTSLTKNACNTKVVFNHHDCDSCVYIYIIIYPPTLAFAKAGAAPGTTGGVDPVFLEPLPRRGSCLSCTFATPTLQANAITRPQQWLKASPRPQQWLLIGVHGCRLTGFKPLKRLKCLAGRLPA